MTMIGEVEIGGRFGRLYRLLDWAARLAVVNLLWIAGTAAGLVVAGVSPATAAMFWLLREYRLGRRPPWRDFWRQWRAQLVPAQITLGLPIATVFVLAFYLVMATERGGGFHALTAALAVLSAGYLATLPYLPVVLSHFDLPTTAAWRLAALAAWRQPATTVGLAAVNTLLILVMVVGVPAALPFYAVSLPALLATRAGHRAFRGLLGKRSPEGSQHGAA